LSIEARNGEANQHARGDDTGAACTHGTAARHANFGSAPACAGRRAHP
jgi:hypothetical protein